MLRRRPVRIFCQLSLLSSLLLACGERPLAARESDNLARPLDASAPAPAPEKPIEHDAIEQDAEEREMLQRINGHRAAYKLAPLALEARLMRSARWLSKDMAARDYFSHIDSLGRDSFSRMDAFGFELDGWRGENIACGNETAQATYQQWLYSPAHNAGMLDPHYTVIGIARTYDKGSAYGWYWTTDFGSR